MGDHQTRDYRIFETPKICALIFFQTVVRNSYKNKIPEIVEMVSKCPVCIASER